MGGIDAVEYSTLGWLLLLIAPAAGTVIWRGLDWNLMAVGEEWAASRGVSAKSMLVTGYLAASLLTAPVTAVTGPIGFLGLIVPHALRLRIGADHRVLLPCSFLLGAAFLATCDAVGRVVMAPAELPVGIITSLSAVLSLSAIADALEGSLVVSLTLIDAARSRRRRAP